MRFTEDQKEVIVRAKAELLYAAKNRDQEDAHIIADTCLCDILESFGLTEIVEIFNGIDKWYA